MEGTSDAELIEAMEEGELFHAMEEMESRPRSPTDPDLLTPSPPPDQDDPDLDNLDPKHRDGLSPPTDHQVDSNLLPAQEIEPQDGLHPSPAVPCCQSTTTSGPTGSRSRRSRSSLALLHLGGFQNCLLQTLTNSSLVVMHWALNGRLNVLWKFSRVS